jgi:hypothetical protein
VEYGEMFEGYNRAYDLYNGVMNIGLENNTESKMAATAIARR